MRDWESVADDELLGATPGDAGAFSVFYRRYERLVLVYFRRRVGDSELAADLTAEVFAGALSGASRFRPGGAPPSAWLFAIAQNVLLKSQRRGRVEDAGRRRLGMVPVVLEDEDLARIDRLSGTREAVIGALDDLPEEQREAVRARVLDDRSYGEIAGELRCSEAVVRKRVSRGLARMREQLEEESGCVCGGGVRGRCDRGRGSRAWSRSTDDNRKPLSPERAVTGGDRAGGSRSRDAFRGAASGADAGRYTAAATAHRLRSRTRPINAA